MKKGESIKFIGFTILYCSNNDGLVLLSPEDENLGNFDYNKAGIDNAKQAAIIYYMLSKSCFKCSLLHKIMSGTGSGTQFEWFLLKGTLEADKLTMPKEITYESDNGLIYYKKKPLQWLRK